VICPRCNTVSDTSETACRACRALIAAVPVPFFRGADDWKHPAHDAATEAVSSHADLAAQFDDPVFNLGGEEPHTDGPTEFSVPDTSHAMQEQVPDTSHAMKEQVPDTSHAMKEQVPDTSHAMQEQVPDTSHAMQEQVPDTSHAMQEPVPDTSHAMQEPVPDTSTVQASLPPGWRRLAAGAVDALPLCGALMLMLLFFERDLDVGGAPLIPTNLHELGRMFTSLGTHGLVILAAVSCVSVLYHAFSLAFMRATVGDLLFGIRWVTLSGEAPSLGRSLMRALLQLPSWLLAMCGVWFVFFTRTKRTLYDVLTGCYPILRSS
jgi:uncharacterized RDD family membrane protein YckC